MALPISILSVLLMCCAVAVLASAFPDSYDDKPTLPSKKPVPDTLYTPFPSYTALAVEGIVLCQNCKFVGSQSVTYATPLPGAKVKLACQTGYRYKTFFTATARTDYNGFFIVRVPSFDFKTFSPLKNCVVLLVYSPYAQCSTPTDINYGLSGAPLHPERGYKVYQARFSVRPLVFAPLPCKRPVTYYKNKAPITTPGYSPPPAPVALAPAPAEDDTEGHW